MSHSEREHATAIEAMRSQLDVLQLKYEAQQEIILMQRSALQALQWDKNYSGAIAKTAAHALDGRMNGSE